MMNDKLSVYVLKDCGIAGRILDRKRQRHDHIAERKWCDLDSCRCRDRLIDRCCVVEYVLSPQSDIHSGLARIARAIISCVQP